jgi:hypothetical protein
VSTFSWPPPRIGAPLPDGWWSKQSWTLFAPDGQANIIVSCEPLAPPMDTAGYATRQQALLSRELNGYVEYLFTQVELTVGQALLRVFGWSPPNGVPITQHQMYWTAPGIGYTATATVPSTQYDRFRGIFDEVLSQVRFLPIPEPPIPPGGRP